MIDLRRVEPHPFRIALTAALLTAGLVLLQASTSSRWLFPLALFATMASGYSLSGTQRLPIARPRLSRLIVALVAVALGLFAFTSPDLDVPLTAVILAVLTLIAFGALYAHTKPNVRYADAPPAPTTPTAPPGAR